MKNRSSQIKPAFLIAAAAVIGWAGIAAAGPLPATGQSPLTEEAAIGRAEIAPNLRRQVVGYPRDVAAGTVVVDTAQTYLYFVLGGGKAIRYGIGVGREGFTWSGVETVTRKAEWPDWTPPAEMIARQPYLARFTAGGEGNPLGARAMYLGRTAYRIHGTNMPETIGQNVSSGCIRLLNEDVIDLYSRVNVGTRIVVLPNEAKTTNVSGIVPARFAAQPAYAMRSANIY